MQHQRIISNSRNIFRSASFVLLVLAFIGVMSCHDKSANASDVAVPEGVKMKSMKFDGCSFLYPDFLTKFKTPTAEGEEPDEEEEGQGMFVLNEGDLMNSLVYEERKLDTLYSKKAAEEFLQQLQADEGSTVNNSQIMDDGFMVDVEVLNAKVAPVKLYTTIAFKAKDLKSLTLTYTYTENNKEKMSAVKEAIVKSMKVQ